MTAILLAVSILPATDTDQQPVVIVVLGASGTPEYGRQFNQWADRWHRGLPGGSSVPPLPPIELTTHV